MAQDITVKITSGKEPKPEDMSWQGLHDALIAAQNQNEDLRRQRAELERRLVLATSLLEGHLSLLASLLPLVKG